MNTSATKPKQSDTPQNKPALSDPQLHGEDFYQMVSEAAYYRAEKRGFEPGYEIEDWIAAEAEILDSQKESMAA